MFRKFALTTLMAFPLLSTAATFSTWESNDSGVGNYLLTITDKNSGVFNINLTVNPWNAEPLALYLDLGALNFSSNPTISNITTSPTANGSVSILGLDVAWNGISGGAFNFPS